MTIATRQYKQNIKSLLNQLDWDLYKLRCITNNHHLDPICVYILVHLYITNSWIFIDDAKCRQCDAMARFDLVKIKNHNNGLYQITSSGRRFVELYLPHYMRIFLTDLLTMWMKKIFESFIVFCCFKSLEPYSHSSTSLIPSMPVLSSIILIGASMILGCLCGFIIVYILVTYRPMKNYRLEPQADQISFIKFIDTFHSSSWMTNRVSVPYSYLIHLLNNTVFPDSDKSSLLSPDQAKIRDVIRSLD